MLLSFIRNILDPFIRTVFCCFVATFALRNRLAEGCACLEVMSTLIYKQHEADTINMKFYYLAVFHARMLSRVFTGQLVEPDKLNAICTVRTLYLVVLTCANMKKIYIIVIIICMLYIKVGSNHTRGKKYIYNVICIRFKPCVERLRPPKPESSQQFVLLEWKN